MSFRGRFRRPNMSIRPVHRIKHVVDLQDANTLGTNLSKLIVNTKDAPVLTSPDQVETGSKVNGIYLRVEAYATSSAALANVYMAVFKNTGGNLVNPTPSAVGIDDNKKFVIHQEMVMMQKQTNSNPRTLFNGVIVIPRGLRRFGPNDQLYVITRAPGISYEQCIQCIYKEFR